MRVDKFEWEEVDEIKLLSEKEVEKLISSGEKVTPALVECFKLYRAYNGAAK